MLNFLKSFKISNTRVKMFSSLVVLVRVSVKHCWIFLLWCKWYRKYFSMGKILKVLTFTSLFKKEKVIFVCLSCCKENECIFQMLLEFWLDYKDILCFKKKSVRDWKGEEECILLHYTKCNFRRKCNFILNKSNHYWSIFQINVHSFTCCFVLALQ